MLEAGALVKASRLRTLAFLVSPFVQGADTLCLHSSGLELVAVLPSVIAGKKEIVDICPRGGQGNRGHSDAYFQHALLCIFQT
jgi:hypothetical protein